MKRVSFFAIIACLIATSCNKNDSDNEFVPVQTADYMQLKIGNYWVYEQYRLDTSGNEIVFGEPDSSLITGDTLIRGMKYFVLRDINQAHSSYLRDSSGYLVNVDGDIIFSDDDFSNVLRLDTIGPGLATVQYRMIDGDTNISTPLGSFICMYFKGTVESLDPGYPHGTQYTYYFWADGYGMIKSNAYFYNNPSMRTGQRLRAFGNIL